MKDHGLFPNGTSHELWRDSNCDRCKKDYVDTPESKGGNPLCKIEEAIAMAAATDGSLPSEVRDEIAKRLKWDGATYLCHDCPEFEAAS